MRKKRETEEPKHRFHDIGAPIAEADFRPGVHTIFPIGAG
ncbi:hypothetical protein SAMN05444170_1505 [Bradyrhizobium erythrophlei]|uniref:Uncharacterized protein n=1 Tax=Bradyrhizobium erythrophlei TaxID=1437360 RepID=A0A1M7TEJ6_9BRAD|nr:hypothetical protein SAMN05444170_1505 [Bradyrhizobium erythrophlei]